MTTQRFKATRNTMVAVGLGAMLAMNAPIADAACPRVHIRFASADSSACGTLWAADNTLLTPEDAVGPFIECGTLHIGGGDATAGPQRAGGDFVAEYFMGDLSGEHCEDPNLLSLIYVRLQSPSPLNLGPPAPAVVGAGVDLCVRNHLYGACDGNIANRCIQDSDCPGGSCYLVSDGDMSAISGAISVSISAVSDFYISTADQDPTTAGIDPCPACRGGTCTAGANAGGACTANNPAGLTNDCPPSGASLRVPYDAVIRNTPPVAATSFATSSQSNVFCGFCADANDAFRNPPVSCQSDGDCAAVGPYTRCRQRAGGALGNGQAARIDLLAIEPGDVTDGQEHVAISSSFLCVPPTFNPVVDSAVSLPGPAAVAHKTWISMTTACGDNIVNPGEHCDDGNTLDGDCCTSSCQLIAQGTPCPDDGFGCTTDLCDANGHCAHELITCPPQDQCHDATCPFHTCAQSPKANDTSCDDQNACTLPDTCQSGVCTGTPRNCDDNNACTVDSCDPSSGCVHAPDPACTCTANAQCNDNNPCTAHACQAGTCSNLALPNGTSCSDSTVCNGSETCQAGICQQGTALVCNDGNACTTDACDSATGCTHTPVANCCGQLPNGAACEDGDLCTHNETCQAGVCAGAVAQPATGCRQSVRTGGARLMIEDGTPDDRDAFSWKWGHGTLTTVADFGSPTTDTSYGLCVYDEGGPGRSARVVLRAGAPANGSCGGKPCWRRLGDGFRYRDPERTPSGLDSILLKEGFDGKARVRVKGRGLHLAPAPMPYTPAVTVQLFSSQGECWEARYSAPTALSNSEFGGTSD